MAGRMQPNPPPQPYAPQHYPPPARPGWGRFWLGVVAGGCAVLLLEALALVIVVLLAGAAINAALHQSGSGALPGGFPLPAGLPNPSAKSDPCSPQPCLAHGGVTLLVGGVHRDAGQVQVDVTFADASGAHTVTPAEVAVRDSAGSITMAGAGASGARCADLTASQDLQPGQRAGPFPLCYPVAASSSLTLVWIIPEDLSLIELKLPQ